MKTQIIHKAYRTVITHEGMTTVVPDRQGSHRVTHVKASGIPEAPSDGRTYARRVSKWYPLTDAAVSTDPNNRAATGSDGGIYVSDDLNPDPLAYYIIARG